MTARTISPYDTVTEKQWQEQIRGLLKLQGYRCYHTHDSRRSEPGYPDIVAINPRTRDIFVAELKTERGIATPRQIEWLNWFELADICAYIWRPSMIDEIVARVSTKVRIRP